MNARPYAEHSLQAVLVRIVEHSDVAALAEFHDHRTFLSIGEESELLFAQFVRRLEDYATRQDWARTEIDAAVSLTTDKFTRLPAHQGELDCRNTFRPILQLLKQRGEADPLSLELSVANALNGYVRRHFKLALREARRTDARTRFVWNVNGGELHLLMPKTMVGRERAKWLATHVPKPEPSRPGERERVQMIIDEKFAQSAVPLDKAATEVADPNIPGSALDRITEQGLADCVATEKADNVDELRPRIGALGATGVHKLVLRIFDSVTDDDVSASDIAAEFGLDAATLSRFAGKLAPGRAVPDLWRNLANLLASDVRFLDACRGANVWEAVQKIVSPNVAR